MIWTMMMTMMIPMEAPTSNHQWFHRMLNPEILLIRRCLNFSKVWNQYRAEQPLDLVFGSSTNSRCMTSYYTAATSANVQSACLFEEADNYKARRPE